MDIVYGDRESFGLIGIQLSEKYKENVDISSEGVWSIVIPF
jgi:hypothetical protein